MFRKEEFELSKFLPETLCLGANVSPACSPTFSLTKHTSPNRYAYLYDEDPLKALGETGDWSPLHIDENEMGTPVQEFYRGLNIFITGGTGFIGKVLFQKLLRSIPHIGHVYLLVRAKKGVSSQERFAQLLQDKLFLRMKAEVPGYLDKIRVVEGDLAEEGLGLSSADRQLLIDNVHVVFHSAADVRFLEPLKSAVISNVIGSERVLQLAKAINKLKVYVHVSTAFSHCVRRVIEEKCYTMSVHYKDLIQYMKNKTSEEVEQEADRLLQGWPNSYTFSKALSESMVQEEADGLPLCIYRPTVVWPTVNDPVCAWTDNINGPNGMIMAVLMGVLHVAKLPDDISLDCVPVDLVVNSLIVVARDTAMTTRRSCDPIKVYNFASTPQKQVTWKSMLRYGDNHTFLFPLASTIWKSFLFTTESNLIFYVLRLFLHTIPGLVLDFLAAIMGKKPRLSKVYNKIHFLLGKLEYFGSGQWEFKNDSFNKLWSELAQEDKKLFPFDVMAMDVGNFILLGKLGLRYYIQKEEMATLPTMVQRQKWFEWAHYTFSGMCGLIALKIAVALAHQLPI